MKKYLLLGAIGLSLTLAGCGQQPQNTEVSSETCSVTGTGSCTTTWETQTDLSLTTENMCANAIKDHLAKADLKGKGTKVVEKWHQIVVHYVGRLDEEIVFDTSVEEVAKACGKYMSGRNYNEWLAFTVGAGQMIPGFDKGVEGMKIGQTKTVTIPAKEAYGEWSKDALVELDRSQLPAGEYKKGMKLYNQYGQAVTINEVKDKTVVLDTNHELAGKDLIFDITLVSIK